MKLLLYKTILLIAVLLLCTGCAVYYSRFYSEPEVHKTFTEKKQDALDKMNPRYSEFETGSLPSVFTDSLDNTIVTLQLLNNYERIVFGPPFIPVIKIMSGYGYPEPHKKITEDINSKQLIVELSIRNRAADDVRFIPSSFYIIKRNNPERLTPVLIDSSADLSLQVNCPDTHRWRIVFTPGAEAEDLPVVYLQSLTINGKPFYPEGIRFKKGKKSFYSPMISVNG